MAAVAMPTSPVPLDTIPVSPADGNGDIKHDESEIVTVFHDADNFNVKHPLGNTWTLWFTKPPSGKGDNNWNDLLKEVITFDSVEEFWGIYVSCMCLIPLVLRELILCRTTLHPHPSYLSKLITISSNKAFGQNGRTPRTNTAVNGHTQQRSARAFLSMIFG